MNKVFKNEKGRQLVQSFHIEQRKDLPLKEVGIKTCQGKTVCFLSGKPESQALLLIHGTGSNILSWLGIIEELSQQYYLILPEIPGEPGMSEDHRFPCKGEAFTLWIEDILDELKLKSVILGGQSLGAWASLRYAIDRPERVSKLFLLSPSGLIKPKGSYLFLLLFSLLRGEKGIQYLIKRMHNQDSYSPEEFTFFKLLMKHCRFREDQPPLFRDDELKSCSSPILYMGGDRDILLNTRKSAQRLQSLLPESRISIVAEGGHALENWQGEFLDFAR